MTFSLEFFSLFSKTTFLIFMPYITTYFSRTAVKRLPKDTK